MNATLHRRLIAPRFAEALEDSPVVLIEGPRQCGKTTFAQMMCAPAFLPEGAPRADAADASYTYLNFDDNVVRAAAEADPMGFIADLPERVVLDEVQRVPGLFTALKLAVDRRRTPGRFVLTGSTQVLAIPALADSLAGRIETVRLHPLAQRELHPEAPAGPAGEGFIDGPAGEGFIDGPAAKGSSTAPPAKGSSTAPPAKGSSTAPPATAPSARVHRRPVRRWLSAAADGAPGSRAC